MLEGEAKVVDKVGVEAKVLGVIIVSGVGAIACEGRGDHGRWGRSQGCQKKVAMEGGVEARALGGSTERSMEGGSAKWRRRVLSVDATTWEKGRRRWSQRLTCKSHLMVHN